MKFPQWILVLVFTGWAMSVKAQVPEEASSAWPTDQWQLSLDVIKSKAQSLMIKNNGLQDEYRQLMAQLNELERQINDQQNSNGQIANLLKERHGQTDQQGRIMGLTEAIQLKKQGVRNLDQQLENWQRKQAQVNNQIQQLKYTISGIEFRQQAQKPVVQAPAALSQPVSEAELTPWRQRLEEETQQETQLEDQLQALKTGNKVPTVNADAVNAQNKELEGRLDMLRLQVVQHFKKPSDTTQARANVQKYEELKKRKDELEAQINAYEGRLDSLRESSLPDLSWGLKKKKLVHEMVQIDSRDNRMRSQIKVLREDIDVLRDQVARLERRLDFARDKSPDQAPSSAKWTDLTATP